MKGSFVEKDLGYVRILNELAAMETMAVEVGLQNDGTSSDDGVLVAHYGAVNEFGTRDGHVPERSFMRSTFDETVNKLVSTRAKIIGGVYAGKLTAEIGAGLLGELHQKDVQKKISSHPPPPNAPSTIAKKGSSGTLVDTGLLRQSVRWVLQRGSGGSALRVLARRIFKGAV